MDQIDSEKFLAWLNRELKPICGEEPDALAQYVEALIKDDDLSKGELKEHCLSELSDFLEENTEAFVNKMFAAIEDESYKEHVEESRSEKRERAHSPVLNQNRRDTISSAHDSDGEVDYDDDDDDDDENYRRRRFHEMNDDEDRSKRHRYNEVDSEERGNAAGKEKSGFISSHQYNGGYGSAARQQNMGGYGNSYRMGFGDNFAMRGNNFGGSGGMWDPSAFGRAPAMWPMNAMGGQSFFPQQPYAPPPPPPPPPRTQNYDEVTSYKSGSHEQNWRSQGYHSCDSDEQCTVKCTGIPQYVKEVDLYNHFSSFGRIVKLSLFRLAPENDIDSSGKGKVYNEAMVQFHDVSEAKKCLGSPQSVLDNRFIKLFSSKENLIAPRDVDNDESDIYPGFREDQLNHKISGEGNFWKGGKGGKGGGRFGGKGSRFGGRGLAHSFSKNPSESEEEKQPDDEEAAILKEQLKEAAKLKREEMKHKRETEAKHQYEELKSLRHQAESILRKKEELLQGQIDQFRGMMNKVEKICGTDEAEKARMIESLESKVLDLQGQLQSVRQQRVSGQTGTSDVEYNGRSYKGGRSGGRNYYRGGKGRGGRGRGGKGYYGRGGDKRGERTIDNRSKCLVVGNAPKDFLGNAHLHFSKFGEVVKTSKCDGEETNPEKYLVEFSNVHGAEAALRGGLQFNDTVLTAEYFKPSTIDSSQEEEVVV